MLDNLRELASSEKEDFIAELLNIFVVSGPEALAQIQKAAQTQDLEV